MKKLMLLAALLAVLALAAIPAIAQVTQEGEQEGESAELDQTSSQTQSGDNSISCVNDQLTGNTGNAQTLNQGLQYASEGSVAPSGNATITLTPNERLRHEPEEVAPSERATQEGAGPWTAPPLYSFEFSAVLADEPAGHEATAN